MIVATRLLPPVFLRKIPPCFPFLYKFISSSTSMMGRIIYWDILSTKPQVPWIFDTSFEMFILFHIEKFSLCSLDNWKRSHTMPMCLCLPAGMPEPLHRWPVRCCRPKPQRRTRWTAKKKKRWRSKHGISPRKSSDFCCTKSIRMIQRLKKKHWQKNRWKLKWYCWWTKSCTTWDG